MNIHFHYHGSAYEADLSKQEDDTILVLFDNNQLGQKFGSSLPFYVKNKTVEFNNCNRCHSDLFALNSSISKAIEEQCEELLS